MYSTILDNLATYPCMPDDRYHGEEYTPNSIGCPTVDMEGHPATANCRRLLERGDHVLIGVSPFNSRFNESYLTRLFSWAATSFDRFTVLLPGEQELALTLEAAGTQANKAPGKARQELNRKTRMIHAALEAVQVAPHDDLIIRFSDFAAHPAYRTMVAAAEGVYRDSSTFRAACEEMSAQVVRGRQRVRGADGDALSREQIEMALQYVFAEIPFFINTPALLNLPGSVLAYHRPWPIGDLLFSGSLPIRVDARQGYVIVHTPEDAHDCLEVAA